MMGDANLLIPETLPPYAAAPIVDRRKVDLPTMTLSYVFSGWNKDSVLVEIKLDWGDGAHVLSTKQLAAGADGVFHAPVVGGDVTIVRTPNTNGSVTITGFTPRAAVEKTPNP